MSSSKVFRFLYLYGKVGDNSTSKTERWQRQETHILLCKVVVASLTWRLKSKQWMKNRNGGVGA